MLKTGKENAIHMQDLAEQAGVSVEKVKRAIRAERQQGADICSGFAGYWLPANEEERAQFIRMMNKQAITRFNSTKGTRRALKQISGQMELEGVR